LTALGKFTDALYCFNQIPTIDKNTVKKMISKLRTQLMQGKIKEALLEEKTLLI